MVLVQSRDLLKSRQSLANVATNTDSPTARNQTLKQRQLARHKDTDVYFAPFWEQEWIGSEMKDAQIASSVGSAVVNEDIFAQQGHALGHSSRIACKHLNIKVCR